MAEADEEEINLESLKLLKEIFDAADEDGSGELDIEEFCCKLGPHLGINLKRQQVAQLFMKIDANAGGTVDWDEFTNYMFLEKAQAAAGESTSDNWRLFPGDIRDKNESSAYHHEQVDKLYFCASIDKYVTCGRDGTFRLWNAAELKHVRTVTNGTSWITDCMYLPLSRKMVFTTMDRAITYYDIYRGSYDLTGRVYASGAMGVPLALHVLSGDAGERVVYGDSKGAVVLLLCGSRELPARDLVSIDNHKDYIYLHKEHSDWITKMQWIPEVGLVSSSLDTTIKTFDINRERITHTCTHHAKGVHSFVWCKAYSCFASCGLERDVTVWHGTTGRKIGDLRGHTSSVVQIALDDNLNHVFTLSIDRSIKVWDLRNHKCLQTILEDDWVCPEDSQPTCLMYDSSRRRLVTANHGPYVWQHKVTTQDRTGHREPVRGALYNSTFSVVVSVDEGGTTCVWNMQDGCRECRFIGGHDGSKVTAVSFDKGQRRLVTAANNGTILMWNFNNGSLIKSFSHDQDPLEVTEVLFARDEKRGSDIVYAAGWNGKVFVWEDEDDELVSTYKTYEGHTEDVLAMAAYPPKQLLASGDYQGRIIIWGLMTGEKKSWLSHRAERYETSVERLLWLPAYSPQQRQAAAATAKALVASAASLAGVTASLSQCGLPADVQDAGQRWAVVQDNSGSSSVPLVVVPSLMSLRSEASVAADPMQQQQPTTFADNRVEPQTSTADAAGRASSDLYDASAMGVTSGTNGLAATEETDEPPDAVLLLSAGGDGVIRVWLINILGQGQLLCTLPGAQAVLDVTSAIGVDDHATVVVVGDSGGHLRVFDVSAGIDTSSSAAAAASFKQRAHWQAHDGAVASVDVIPAHPISGYSHAGAITSVTYDPNNPTIVPPLIVSGSRDSNIAVWTLDGGLVGFLGEHSWDVEVQTTWQDPKGLNRRPPKPRGEGMYVNPADQLAAGNTAVNTDVNSIRKADKQAIAGQDAPCYKQQRQSSILAGLVHTSKPSSLISNSHQDNSRCTEPISNTPSTGAGQLSAASLILQESKQKRHDSMVNRPVQPHCQLTIHELQDVEGTAGDILRTAAEKRKNRGRQLIGNSSGNSHSSTWSGVGHLSKG